MEFKDLQDAVVKNGENYGQRYNIKIDGDFALLKLYEEVGEFSQALLIHKGKCRPEKFESQEKSKEHLGQEMADVLGLLMMNAHLLEIDLEENLKKKWINREK
jgi:NTP pyrophosphatase (non-canonical NTP hydrolase)